MVKSKPYLPPEGNGSKKSTDQKRAIYPSPISTEVIIIKPITKVQILKPIPT